MENVTLKVLKTLPENYHLQMFIFPLTTLITNYLIIHFELQNLACTVSIPHTYISRKKKKKLLKFFQLLLLEHLQNLHLGQDRISASPTWGKFP